jgi:hypothetical protein
MSGTLAETIDDKPMTAGATAPRPFGWTWVWRSLRLRKWRLLSVFALTFTVYAAGLVLPLCTQQAVDLIAAGPRRGSYHRSHRRDDLLKAHSHVNLAPVTRRTLG